MNAAQMAALTARVLTDHKQILADANDLQLDHHAERVECWPPSPLCTRMRLMVAVEQRRRRQRARDGALAKVGGR